MSVPVLDQDILQTQYQQFKQRRYKLQEQIQVLETRWQNFAQSDEPFMVEYRDALSANEDRAKNLRGKLNTIEKILPTCRGFEAEKLLEVKRQTLQFLEAQRQSAINIKKLYAEERQSIRDQQKQYEHTLSQLLAEQQAWALQDRAHLECYLVYNPSHQAQMAQQYQVVHPDEDMSWLIPQSNDHQPKQSARIRERDTTSPQTMVEINQPIQLWQLVLLNDNQSQSFILPQKPTKRQKWLRQQFIYLRIHLHASTVLERLDQITKQYTVQQRQQLEKLVDVPGNWSLVHVGEYRIFLGIDEEKQILRFFIRHRREAYRKLFTK